jgi:KDO2-lipid IV(A) lauroyltransferase
MSNWQRSFLERFGLYAFEAGQKVFLKRDIAVVERRGEMFGEIAFRALKSRRKRTISNLELAFPEWSDRKRFETARKVFRHFGLITADFMRTPLRTNEELLANMEVEGFEHFQTAEASGKGIIACTAHLGNWERFGHWMTATGRSISVVARDANQGAIQERVSKIRDMTGITVLSRGDSARPILLKLKRKEVIGILPDQNSDESFVPFFGKPCGTVLGPAVLHQRTGAVLLPSYCIRIGPGKYKVILRAPIDLENSVKQPEQLMADVNAALESVIREYPEQWLWMHDRWKNARKKNLL